MKIESSQKGERKYLILRDVLFIKYLSTLSNLGLLLQYKLITPCQTYAVSSAILSLSSPLLSSPWLP